jgi:two-component system cell cycle sensor histidine kinase/response regulator CckA
MRKEKILIIENESIIAKDLEICLGDLGWEAVEVTYSGREAVKKASSWQPDLVLIDIKLGKDMDGIEVAQKIATFSDVPIIYLTAYADNETLERAKATQPYGYIIKPFDERSLQATIEMALHKYCSDKRMKHLESQLRQTQKMEALGTLAGGIAHDFNNLLTVILGYTELSMRRLPENNEARRSIEHVFIAAKRAKELVEQILSFSRQNEEKRDPLQISLIVNEVLSLLRSSLPPFIIIRNGLKANRSMVKADSSQIHQVIMNLCTNAVHAMKEKGGILKVSLEDVDIGPGINPSPPGSHIYDNLKPGAYVCLSVSDTGHGMENDVAARIFEPYFTTKNPGEGTGMGLPLVRGIVESHGGIINVHSTRGKGTNFKVFLPRVNSTARPQSTASELIQGGNERILYIDSESVLVELARELLEQLGYTIVGKTDSLNALEDFRDDPHQFDIVITDLTMPHLNGIQLARKFMEIRPDIPIILCTGFSNTIAAREALNAGIKDVVMKPIVLETIAHAIRSSLDRKEEVCGSSTLLQPNADGI